MKSYIDGINLTRANRAPSQFQHALQWQRGSFRLSLVALSLSGSYKSSGVINPSPVGNLADRDLLTRPDLGNASQIRDGSFMSVHSTSFQYWLFALLRRSNVFEMP